MELSVSEAEAEALARSMAEGSVDAVLKVRAVVRGGGAGAAAWRRAGGLKLLARRLQRPPARALLSALADCCLEPASRRELAQLRIEPRLLALLTSDRDGTVCTVCRIVGNLAVDPINAERLHVEGAVAALIKVIDDRKSSFLTLLMAVRAIRLLWTIEAKREEMVSNGAVRSVSMLLCAECMNANLIKLDGSETLKGNMDIFKKRSNLFNGLLKCLGYFSTFPTFQCAQQIIGDGRGYHCLVFLTKKFESYALQCILNLCHVAACRPLLGAAGAVKCVIDLLNRQKEYPVTLVKALSLFCREAVNRAKVREFGGLTVLLSVVRDVSQLTRHLYALQALLLYIFDTSGLKYMAKEGLIDILTALLKDYVASMKCEHIRDLKDDAQNETSDNESSDSENPKNPENRCQKCLILHNKTEECFVFDDCISSEKKPKYDSSIAQEQPTASSSTQKHQSPNLSPYSDCMSSSTGSTNFEYGSQKSYKNFYSYTSADNSGVSLYYNNCSPESTSSSYEGNTYMHGKTGPWSPKYSGICYSPSSISQCDDESVNSEMSGHYSPVCSDIEDEETKTTADLECLSENNEISDDIEDFILDSVVKSSQKLELDDMSKRQVHSHRIRCLLLLLYQFSRYPTKDVKLTTKDLLYSLIYYIEKCKQPDKNMALRTFSKIICTTSNFEHLLIHSIILKISNTFQNPKHGKCKQCKQLQRIFTKLVLQVTTIAETDYGVGHMSNQLSKGDIAVKEALAITIPYIIKSPRSSKKLYVNCRGLDIFTNVLTEHKQPLIHSIPALSQLALNLKIRPPRPIFGKFKGCTYMEYDPNYSDGSQTVFILDDASTVQADSDLLCQHSDVFVAMLRGSFKEGSQKRVRLQQVTKLSLEYLITLLQIEIHMKPVESFPLPKTLPVALETLLLADRFLLEKIKNMLFSAIVQFKLDSSTADKIYIWSLQDGMGTLCMESVAYTLVGHMSNEKRCRIVSTIMNSIYKDQWVDHIKYSLLRFLE